MYTGILLAGAHDYELHPPRLPPRIGCPSLDADEVDGLGRAVAEVDVLDHPSFGVEVDDPGDPVLLDSLERHGLADEHPAEEGGLPSDLHLARAHLERCHVDDHLGVRRGIFPLPGGEEARHVFAGGPGEVLGVVDRLDRGVQRGRRLGVGLDRGVQRGRRLGVGLGRDLRGSVPRAGGLTATEDEQSRRHDGGEEQVVPHGYLLCRAPSHRGGRNG